jgi:hypothetical protein
MMRKVLLWHWVCVCMLPVVAVLVLWRRGYVCVAGGGCAGVAAPVSCTGGTPLMWGMKSKHNFLGWGTCQASSIHLLICRTFVKNSLKFSVAVSGTGVDCCGAVSVSWRKCHKCGELGGQTYIFIFSNTVEEHEQHLKVIFDRLRINFLYLKWTKCELYASHIDCLGHIIDNKGIHPDTDKLSHIRNWHTLRDYTDIQCFVGLVNYVGNFLPDVTSYTSPLLSMTQNGAPFTGAPFTNGALI